MSEQQKATLQDVLNYDADSYLSEDEIDLIRRTFKGNDKLIKVIRKILMPVLEDPDLPIEEMQGDLFLTSIDWATIPSAEVKSIVTARELTAKFILGGLIKLKVIANVKEETPEQIKKRREKDSGK